MLFRRRRNEQEFEVEALPHLDGLFRTAVRLLGGDRQEAEDLVQDVYAHAWKSFDQYEPGTNCRAWLYAILMNKVRHIYRRQQNRKVVSLNGEEGSAKLEQLEASPVVSEMIEDADIVAALDRLNEEFREVLLLIDVQGFSYREGAEVLDIPIGTVMSRLNRGRTLLRETLAVTAREYGIDTSKGKRTGGGPATQ